MAVQTSNEIVNDAIVIPSKEQTKSPKMNEKLLIDNINDNVNDSEYTLNTKPSRLSPAHFIYLCTAIACLSSILLGYDIGIMSGAIVYMSHDLNLSKIRQEIIISSLNLFSIVGAIFGGHISHKIGRKQTIKISALIFFFGALLTAATRNFGIIVLGRVLLGIASGTGLLIAPLYTAELAPYAIRGKLVTFAEISINIGILFGYFIAWLFTPVDNDDLSWRLMISFGTLPAIILFLSMLFMPESPRWLIENGQFNAAYNVLYNVYGNENNDMIISEIEQIKATIKAEQSEKGQYSDYCCGWFDVCCPQNEYIRRALVIGIGIALFQQASGNEAAVYYTPFIFEKAGVSADKILLFTTFVGLAKVLFIFVSTFYLDKVGRRPLLMLSAVLMTLSLFGLTLAFGINSNALTIVFQCCFCGSFSIGWGPIVWVLTSEIFPLHIRSKAMAVCTLVNRLMSGTVALTFLSLQDLLTPTGTWLMFSLISCCSVLFIYKCVPETKQKTLEEITAFLMGKE